MDYNSNGNYPLGANTKDAPFNQKPKMLKEFKVLVEETVSKIVTLSIDDYEEYYDKEDKSVSISTKDTNWVSAYYREHYSIPQLFNVIIKKLNKLKDTTESIYNRHCLEELIKECQAWTKVETTVEEI